MFLFCGLITLLCVLATAFAQYQPIATLYSNRSCSGASVTIPAGYYVPNLDSLDFDNTAHSVSLRGPWMFYDLEFYNIDGDSLLEYIFSSAESCLNFIDIAGHVTSVKYAGHEEDYTLDTITFYELTHFQANQDYVQNDKPGFFTTGIASLIITGSSAWTTYEYTDYNGTATCLQVIESPFNTPTYVHDTILLDPPVPHGSIRSVRKGCFTDNVITLKRDTRDAPFHELNLAPNA